MATSPSYSGGSDRRDDKTIAEAAIVAKLYAKCPTAVAINCLCSLGTVAALYHERPVILLFGWLGLMLLTSLFRLDSYRRFQREKIIDARLAALRRRFVWGAGASGLTWGLSALFYGPDSPTSEIFLPFVVAGMVGGSLLVLTSDLKAFIAFLVGAVFPYVARFCYLGEATHLIMAALVLVYFFGLLLLVRPMSQSIVSGVQLAGMNERLIDQLREKSSQLQATFDHVNQGVAVFDHQARLLTWNPRHRELHGYPVHLYRPGTHMRQFLDQDLARSDSTSVELDPRALAEPLALISFEQGGAEGRTLAVERSGMPGGGFVSTSTDITDHKRVEARMLHLAQHDPLTDLPNRLLFQDRLQQAMARSTRSGSPVGVIVVDLDGFKAVNDQEGHRVGDEVLKAIARRLRSGLRQSDTVARIGGDEFALILPDLTTEKAAVRIGEKVLATIESPMRIDGCDIDPRASMGIAMFPTDAKTAEALLQYADLAMYRAKHAGGGIRVARTGLERQRSVVISRSSASKSKAVG